MRKKEKNNFTKNGMKKKIETLNQHRSIIEAIKNINVEISNAEHSNKQIYESEIEKKMAEDLSDSDQEFHGFIDSETNSYHSNGSDIDPFEQLIIKLEMKQLLMTSNVKIVVELWMFTYLLLFGLGKFNQN